MTHMIMCIDSGINEMKSQNVSWADAACGISLMRFGFDRVDEIRKFDRILDKEDRYIVADQIVVSFLRIELHREPSDVAGKIG